MENSSNIFLESLMRGMKESVFSSRYFQCMKNGELGRPEFRVFASQKIPMGEEFNSLLENGIYLSQHRNLEGLSAALRRNLSDELGTETGDPHSAWKADYLREIGVRNEGPRHLLESTRQITKAYSRISMSGNLSVIAGTILALEFFIPKEYRAAIVCRDTLFPERFVLRTDDTPTLRKRKLRARLYMDDHAEHDEKVHFRELFEALPDLTKNQEDVDGVTSGIQAVVDGRAAFFADLDEVLIGSLDAEKYSE